MLHLNLAYVQQTTRERDVEADLQARQMLRATPHTMEPVEPPASPPRSPRLASVRARAASR